MISKQTIHMRKLGFISHLLNIREFDNLLYVTEAKKFKIAFMFKANHWYDYVGNRCYSISAVL